MRKAFVWVEEQHTLGFLRSKITVEDRFYINLFSVFRPDKGVYIDCFINNIYINFFDFKEDK